jgi:hypothetical protein
VQPEIQILKGVYNLEIKPIEGEQIEMKVFYMHIIWEPSIKRTTHEPFSGLWTSIGHKIYNSCKKKREKKDQLTSTKTALI